MSKLGERPNLARDCDIFLFILHGGTTTQVGIDYKIIRARASSVFKWVFRRTIQSRLLTRGKPVGLTSDIASFRAHKDFCLAQFDKWRAELPTEWKRDEKTKN